MDELVAAATEVRKRAHAPFSGFKVGAALLDADGRVFTGCNVENASYGLTMCAERVTIFHAISEGAGRILTVAVVADTTSLTPPCGACRQILWEFCPGAKLILANLSGKRESVTVQDLLPRAFDASYL